MKVWRDDDTGKLETKIAAIAAGVIVAGEARFRQGLREAIERQEKQEAARQQKLVELNRKRIENLHASGELLRRAEEIRTLVARTKAALSEDVADIVTISAWEAWAMAEADRIDPIKSGQILSHLREPTLAES